MRDKAFRPSLGRSFLGGTSLLVSGAFVGQLLVFAATPLLTRLYGPSDFGVLAVYVAVISIVTAFSSLRYELAILLPKSDAVAVALVGVGLLLVVSVSVVSAVGVLLVKVFAPGPIFLEELRPYLWLVPFGILFSGCRNILTYWCLRKAAFQRLAATQIQLAGGMVVVQAVAGALHAGAFGLLAGHAAGFLAGFFSLVQFLVRTGREHFGKVRRSLVKAVAYRYRNFPLFATWAQMTNVIGLELPAILLASLFSPAVAGFYMLAHRVGSAPVAMLSDGIGKAFMAMAAAARQHGKMDALVIRIFRMLVRIGIFPFIVLGVFAPEVVALVFGSEWKQAGQYLQWLMPWISCVFIFVPVLTLFSVLEKQRTAFGFQIGLLVTRVASLFVGAWIGSIPVAILSYSLSGTLVYLVFAFWIMRQAQVTYREISRVIGFEAVIAVPLWGSMMLCKNFWIDAQSGGAGITFAVLMSILSLALLGVCLYRATSAVKSMRSLGLPHSKGQS